MDFLKTVAKYFIRQLPQQKWQDTIFVFPNHRSSVFFSDAISRQLAVLQRAHKPHVILGLQTTTLADLLLRGSNLQIADPVTLKCQLYDTYKSILPEDVQPLKFETFYSWANVILNDFQDIDNSLAAAPAIYRNVTEWHKLSDDLSYISERQRKAIEEFWNVTFTEEQTPTGETRKVHKRFIETYGRMEQLYTTFRDRLRLQGLAYPAMLYRDAAEDVVPQNWDNPDKQYVFIGFSLLSRAEDAIMTRLQKAQRAQFFWDYQPWMLEPAEADNIYGAGYAVAKWVKKYPAPFPFMPPRETPPERQKVSLITTTYPQTQASVVASEMLGTMTHADATPDERKQSSKRDYQRSVIVIPDEQMLLPVLSVIPTDIVGNINVTMGYDLRYTNISGLAHLLADLQSPLNIRQRDGKLLFSSQTVLAILRHPYVTAVDGLDATREAVQALITRNMSFVSPDESELAALPLTSLILKKIQPQDVVTYVTSIFDTILSHYAHISGATLDRETIWEALKVTRKLTTVIAIVINDIQDARMLLYVLCTMIDQQKVDFKGMPLGGLQLMGILETRAVDFDDVTILDMTEGKWPHKAPATESMIPIVIRRNNNMPTSEDRDSTYNYYFYRLKSRAKKLTMIQPVNENASSSRPTQVSRYVLQMKMLRRQHIDTYSAQPNIKIPKDEPITVDKTVVADLLSDSLTLSPTSISDYIKCPLKFFLRKVAHLNVDDEITEEADNRQLGLIYHAVMEALYKKAPGEKWRTITQEFKESTIKNTQALDDLIISEFAKTMKNSALRTEGDLGGRNILTFKILQNLVIQTIKTEIVDTRITDTEMKINCDVTLPGGRKAHLTGTIDRQHFEPNETSLFVADYKTGSDKTPIVIKSIEELFSPEDHEKVKALTQTLIYCYMLRHAMGVKNDLTPYVIALKYIHKAEGSRDNRVARFGDKDKATVVYTGDFEKEFDAMLEAKLNEILDPATPFTQTTISRNCSYCDYTHVCHKMA